MNIKSKNIAVCPECGAEVRFRKVPYLHQTKICVECGVELQVVNKNPIEVDVLFATDLVYEEDDDDNYDESYDNSHIYQNNGGKNAYWS